MVELRRRLVDRSPWLREPWWAEIGSGTAAVLWSMLAIFYELHLMDLGSLRVLLTIADEVVWQWVGLTLGVAQVTATIADRSWPRWTMAVLAVGWWSLLFVAIAQASTTPSLGLYAVFIALNLVSAAKVFPKILGLVAGRER